MLLKSRLIYLRFLRKSDAARMFAAIEESREELEKYVIGPTRLHSVAEVEGMIARARILRQKRQGYFLGIFTARDRQFAGYVNIHAVNERSRSGEVGYWVRTSCSGRGLATAAAALIVLFGFKELKLHRLVLRAASDNPASWRIAERLGFIYDGIQRHEQLMPRGYIDLKCYSMLEDEFRRLRPLLMRIAQGSQDRAADRRTRT